MNKDILLDILAITEWSTVDELVSALDSAGYWTDEFIDGAVSKAKKDRLRNETNKHKDADGMPKFVSILTPDGERVYKQETLFDLEDYKQTVKYHRDRGQHHIDMAKTYRDRAFKRFRVNIQLTFDFVDHAKKAGK